MVTGVSVFRLPTTSEMPRSRKSETELQGQKMKREGPTEYMHLQPRFYNFPASTHFTPSIACARPSQGSSINESVRLLPLRLILYFPFASGQLCSLSP